MRKSEIELKENEREKNEIGREIQRKTEGRRECKREGI